MATAYKVLGQSNPTGLAITNLYTVPASNSAVISTINVCNLSAANDYFRIAVVPSGQSTANQNYLAYNTVIPALDAISLTLGVTMAANDSIKVYGGTANLSFSAFGSEIY